MRAVAEFDLVGRRFPRRANPARDITAGAKLATATTTIQKPDRIASQTDASRHVGEGDATINPTADANPMRTKDIVAATSAPAMPGPQ